MDGQGNPMDAVVHASAGFMATTAWVAAAFQIGLFGKPYKDVMRQWKQRAGAFIFAMKPVITGRVSGSVDAPVISYPIATPTGNLGDQTLNDLLPRIRQVAPVYKKIRAFTSFPNPDTPDPGLKQPSRPFGATSG